MALSGTGVFGQIYTRSYKSLRLRFLVAILVPAILLVLSISFSMLTLYKQCVFTKNEVLGTKAIDYLFNSLLDLQEVRGLSRMLVWSKEERIRVRRQEAEFCLFCH